MLTEDERRAMDTNVGSTSMIVMEYGSRWPRLVVEQRPDAATVTAIVQQSGEHATSLKQRALLRVSLMSRGAPLESAVLSCGAEADEDTWASRALIARAMLSSLRGNPGHLLLSGDQRMNGKSRRALVALGDSLRSISGETGVSVAVSFA
jgi:hypothetical protein